MGGEKRPARQVMGVGKVWHGGVGRDEQRRPRYGGAQHGMAGQRAQLQGSRQGLHAYDAVAEAAAETVENSHAGGIGWLHGSRLCRQSKWLGRRGFRSLTAMSSGPRSRKPAAEAHRVLADDVGTALDDCSANFGMRDC